MFLLDLDYPFLHNNDICGDVKVDLIYESIVRNSDPTSPEYFFVSSTYEYKASLPVGNVSTAPTLNSQISDHLVTLRIYLEEYPVIERDVSFTVTVIPCEIKQTVIDPAYNDVP